MRSNIAAPVLLVALLLNISSMPAISSADGLDACDTMDADSVVRILDRGIAMQREYAAAAGEDDQTRRLGLLEPIEKYDEIFAYPCMNRVPALIRERIDIALMRKAMEFVVSDQLTADMSSRVGLAAVYCVNPGEVENAWRLFSAADRALLASAIITGLDKGGGDVSKERRTQLRERIVRLRNSDTHGANQAPSKD